MLFENYEVITNLVQNEFSVACCGYWLALFCVVRTQTLRFPVGTQQDEADSEGPWSISRCACRASWELEEAMWVSSQLDCGT